MFFLGGLTFALGIERVVHVALYVNASLMFLIVVLTYLIMKDLTARLSQNLLFTELEKIEDITEFINRTLIDG